MIAKAQAVTSELIEAFTRPYASSNGARANGAGGAAAASGLGRESVMLDVPADEQALRREFSLRNWSDGLPVIAPTEERVEAMLEYCDRDPLEVLGVIAPRRGEATVQATAVCAVMAGCEPRMFPALVAAVQGIGREEFNISGVNATTHPNTVMMLLNGPIAREIGAHGGMGCFGPTFETNATLGRALRLVQLNIGGATPGHGGPRHAGHARQVHLLRRGERGGEPVGAIPDDPRVQRQGQHRHGLRLRGPAQHRGPRQQHRPRHHADGRRLHGAGGQ